MNIKEVFQLMKCKNNSEKDNVRVATVRLIGFGKVKYHKEEKISKNILNEKVINKSPQQVLRSKILNFIDNNKVTYDQILDYFKDTEQVQDIRYALQYLRKQRILLNEKNPETKEYSYFKNKDKKKNDYDRF